MSFWTDERIAILKRDWAAGLSGSQIATRFGGGVSRNAVVAKVWRLGLPQRATSMRMSSRQRAAVRATRTHTHAAGDAPRPKTRKASPSLLPDNRPPRPVEIIPEHLRVSMDDLEHKHCRFPFGEGAEITFCGRTRAPGSSYCASHAITCTPQINLPEPVEATRELEPA